MKRVGSFAIAFVLAAVAVWYFTRDKEHMAAFRSREGATQLLAEYLARKFGGARVLVISNPFTETGASSGTMKMENAGIEGLRKGFGDKTVLKIAYPELKPAARSDPRSLLADPETPTPLSYLVADDAFDKLTPGYDLAISLIGLPAALDKAQCWQNPGKPAFGLLLPDLRIVGTGADVRAAVKSGKLAAFVLAAPNAANQFLLVTPESIEQLTQQYPKLLGPD
ncbi:MAG TPA: hypothetical protein VFC26_09480 [Verrucomicrobiae bacterium]|nr:hypothetical protein [Verrucomicrobiae bacterium]